MSFNRNSQILLSALVPALLAACGAGSDSGASQAGVTKTAAVITTSATAAATATTGKHLYVATTGNDANPGTQTAPLKTIAKADSKATAGYTIHVAPGVYKVSASSLGSAGITTVRSGTATARIKFVSDVKGGAKIVVSGTGITWHSKGSYVDIDGFDISGTGRHGILADGTNLTITRNFIHDLTISGGCNGSGGGAIDTNGGAGGVLINANVIRNIGYAMIGKCATVQGIYIANPNNVVTNNIVSGVAAVAIQQWHGATASTIVNNTVFHSKEGILIGQGDAGTLASGSINNYVANNIVYDNTTYGIIEAGKVGTGNRYVNNVVFKSGTNVKMQKGAVSGTITADPKFVRYVANGTGDYHVMTGSPAIGKGATTYPLTTDVDGASRVGLPRSIGAYK
jgi:hypothetical protein